VARQLGVGLESLRTWLKQTAVDAGTRPGVTTTQHDELVETSLRQTQASSR
jgi:transposase